MSAVELAAVRKVYRDVVALAGVNVAVGNGEVVALLGPNGAGKSTLFELMLGLVRPTSGTVRVLGERPGGAVRSRIGAMLQNAGLPDQVSVAELVTLVARSYPIAVSGHVILDQVGLAHRHRHQVATLSGGERQRLLLAMALVGDPELLLLDEPTASMDLGARRRFWEYSQAAVDRGTTLVFATHDLDEADAVADRVVLLDRGQVVADASPSELKAMVPGCLVTLATDAPPGLVARLPGVTVVEPTDRDRPLHDGHHRLAVVAVDAPSVVVPLVRAGYRLSELTAGQADLETAVARLVGLGTDGREPLRVGRVPA
jgi:ABC-2 type transport system ATP-binding protein